MNKVIIFDSGTLISFTMAGLVVRMPAYHVTYETIIKRILRPKSLTTHTHQRLKYDSPQG